MPVHCPSLLPLITIFPYVLHYFLKHKHSLPPPLPFQIDLKNPKPNKGNSGFTDEERSKFSSLLEAGFIDSFRYLYPERTDAYTWWSYMNKVRARNIGWRIDYFVVSEILAPSIKNASIHHDVMGSDHCPVVLEI